MFPLDDNFVFGDIFFCGWYSQPTKKEYSPTNEVTHPTETPICLWYDVFMPPPLSKRKNTQGTRIFNRRPRLKNLLHYTEDFPEQKKIQTKTEIPICLRYNDFYATFPPTSKFPFNILFFFLGWYFFPKNVPSVLFSTGHISFYFKFPIDNRIFFLPLWTFRSFWSCENHDFFLKKSETWYKFLIVIFFFLPFWPIMSCKKKNLYQHLNKNINFGTFRFLPVLA